MELLDYVDEQDRVIGTLPRDEIHRRGLRHRSAHILLYDENGALFLQRRGLLKAVHPGLWDSSAAGHLVAGEDYLNGACRELAEELGIVLPLTALEEIARFDPHPDNGCEFQRLYRCCSNAPVTLEANEIIDGRWLRRDQLSAFLDNPAEGEITPGLRAALAMTGWL